MLEVLNLKARSSTSKPSLSLIIIIKNSCSNVSFLFGPRLLIEMSSLSYLGDCNIMLVCTVFRSFYFCGYEALFRPFQYLITIALDLTWLDIVLNVVVDSKPVQNMTSYT